MTLIVPDTQKAIVLTDMLGTIDMNLRLYSNNFTPSGSMVIGSITEVAGGGYAAQPLLHAQWVIVSGVATYVFQDFHFSGTTNAPGTVYGYYIQDNSGNLILAERFPSGVLPFSPTGGSLIRITPTLTVTS